MPTTWSAPRGPVTLHDAHGHTWVFQSFKDALRHIGSRRLTVVDRFKEPFLASDYFIRNQSVILRDECGLVIPVWLAEQEARDPSNALVSRWKRYPLYNPERDFRKTPVAGTARRSFGRMFRNMRTQGERRALCGLEADLDDLETAPVHIKIRGRRKNIPSAWDDVMISERSRSWKEHRKTQYKKVE